MVGCSRVVRGTVSYFAAAAIKSAGSWTASEFSLSGAADVEDVADRLRDVDVDADVSLLFVESDDVYLVVLRLDQGEDLRVFGSDSAFAEESRLGAPSARRDRGAGAGDRRRVVRAPTTRSRTTTAGARRRPGRRRDLLADLGCPPRDCWSCAPRRACCPADITAELCHLIGCGDEVEELREA
jgi:putative tRNA adenosine deaminase-associated protein